MDRLSILDTRFCFNNSSAHTRRLSCFKRITMSLIRNFMPKRLRNHSLIAVVVSERIRN